MAAFVAVAANGATPHTTPRPSPHFLKPIKADYDSQNLTQQQRSAIDYIVLTVPGPDRRYIRWEMWYGDVIVFEVKPSQKRSDGRGYSPSQIINDPNFYVDPADGSVFAGPPDSSPRIYASRWDPTCRGPLPPLISPPPGTRSEQISRIQPRIWPGFSTPTVADYDAAHLDQGSRDLIDRIVGSLPSAERPNVRWLHDGDTVAVFEVTLAQFCPGQSSYVVSPVINEPRRFVSPIDGEFSVPPPE
jgi:hypothetical protein